MQKRMFILSLDTSVIGRYYDFEFEKDTKPLFENINKGELKCIMHVLNA